MQSGKPVGVFRTHEWAPRVLIANSNLVGDWATWEQFRKLEAEGLTMYGQMTAGSWIYIGTQGILQGTYETFGAVARRGSAARWPARSPSPAGCGGMGGAQPLAVTMNDGVAICVDGDETRIDRRIEHRYLDAKAADLDDALRLAVEARDARRPLSIGLLGNAAEVLPELLRRERPDRHRHRPDLGARSAVVPARSASTFDDMKKMADKDPVDFTEQAQQSMAKHVAAMVGFKDRGAEVFDYGNSIRDEARKAGYDRAFDFPGFVPAYIRPQFEEGLGPVPLGGAVGRSEGHRRHRPGDPRALPGQRAPAPLDRDGRREGRVPGPARAHLLARLRRAAPRRAEVQRDGGIRRTVRARS